MKSVIYDNVPRFVLVLLLNLLFLCPNQVLGQTMDVEFINFQISDTVTIGEPFLVTGTLRNNGNTVVPANLDMLIETYIPNQSPPVFDGDYIQDNFGNVNLQPAQIYNFAKYITADPAHFVADEKIIVIIWPFAPNTTDIDSTNNYHYDQIYVRNAGPSSSFAGSVCNDQTLALGYEGSNTAFIKAAAVGGTPPYSYAWNTGHTTSEIMVAPTVSTTYFVIISDAAGNSTIMTHTIDIVDIRCGTEKVTMCHDTHTHCVETKDVQKKLGEGYTAGNCQTIFTRSDCGIPPVLGCDCNDGMTSITLQYNGNSGATVSGYLEDKPDDPLESYSNIQAGDVLVFTSASTGENKFKSKTFFSVNGQGFGTEIHTSCSQDIQGGTFGDFTVVEYIDGEGYTCQAPDMSCQCQFGLQAVSLRYLGPPGIDIFIANGLQGPQLGSFANVNTGDVLQVNAASIGQGQLDDIIRIENSFSSTAQFINSNCSDELLGTFGDYELFAYTDVQGNSCPVPPMDCDCDGGIKVIAFTYTGAAGATINVFNKDDEFVESYANVQAGERFVAYAASIGKEKFSDFRIHVQGNSPIDLHTSCSQDITGSYNDIEVTGFVDKEGGNCNVPDYVAPPEPCDCDGGIKAIAFTYTGAAGATINVYNSDDGSDLIESYSAVQSGASFIVYASSIGEEKFNKEFSILVLGSSNVELHTSCSQEIVGTYQDIEVTGYVDKYDGVCNVPEYVVPEVCNCEGGMTSISLQYVGTTFTTLSAYNDKDLEPNDLIRVSTLFPLDIFTITATSINESDFNNNVALAVNGVKIGMLHTSCSQDIIGTQIGDFVVTSHTDTKGNTCNSPVIPQSREWVDVSSFMHVFPNPAKDEINLYFQLPDTDLVTVGLYNMEGKLVKPLLEEEAEGLAENEIKFYLSDIPPGVYFIRTTTRSGMYGYQKIVLLP